MNLRSHLSSASSESDVLLHYELRPKAGMRGDLEKMVAGQNARK